MARISQRQLESILAQLEPKLRKVFLRIVRNSQSLASVNLIAELVRLGRVDDIVEALGINQATLSELTEAVRSAYASAGQQGSAELPVLRIATGTSFRPVVSFSFDMRNPRAEEWLRRQSSELVTSIVNNQREAIRVALTQGMAVGDNPRQTALNIIGRVTSSGNRVGGVVGLTEQQSQFVVNMREQLRSGNARQMQNYFNRERRDKRFDAIVRKAIAAGKPVDLATIDKIADRYADRLLQLRGENIARTESLAALNAGRQEAFSQAVQSGKLSQRNVRKVWSSTMDGRTRDSHTKMNGVTVDFDEPFTMPSGNRMMRPGDTSLGAGGEDVINCRCMVVFKVDMIGATLRRRK